jgi:hypothetical protein
MFYENEKVKTCKEVTAKERDTLVLAGIKPGTIGTVISEITYVTVNFNGKLVTLNADSLEGVQSIKEGLHNNEDLDMLKGFFGFK